MKKEYKDLHELLMDPLFPEIDLQLRAGWHCDEEEVRAYQFISEAFDWMSIYYDLYGCDLVYASEGYYYLNPTGNLVKTYSPGMEAMIVSQFLALMKMDPRYLETSGYFHIRDLLERIDLLLGKSWINRIFLHRKKKRDMIGEQDFVNFQLAVKKALRQLSRMGFVTINADFSKIYPRKSIYRFLESLKKPEANPDSALKSQLITRYAELNKEKKEEDGDGEGDGE